MNENIPFWVVPATINENEFFLFRENGIEIRVKYKKGRVLDPDRFT